MGTRPRDVSALIVPPKLVSIAIKTLQNLGWQQKGGVVRRLTEDRAVEINEGGARVLRSGEMPHEIHALIEEGAQVHLSTQAPETAQELSQPLRLLPLKTDDGAECSGVFEPFTFIELFSGIGGFRVALDHLGGRCVFSCDKDEVARSVYRANFGDDSWPDVVTAYAEQIPPHDILTGGFPCQPFSVIGQQKGFFDARGTLFREIVRILSMRRPKAFLLENVPGLITMESGAYLRTILAELSGVGYTVGFKVLDARGLVPQVRSRIFLVGIRTDLEQSVARFAFPAVPLLERSVAEILEQDPSPELFLSPSLWAKIEGSSYYRLHPTKKVVDVNGYAATLIRNYKKSAVFCQFVRQPEDQQPRLFSPREFARLQGFPESFLLPTDEGKHDKAQGPRVAYKLLGNAVPPPIVALVASALLCALQHSNCNTSTSGVRSALELCGLASPGANAQRFLSRLPSSKSLAACELPNEEEPLEALPPGLSEAIIEDSILNQFQVELHIGNSLVGKLIGRGGATITAIRARCAPARIFFPKVPEAPGDKDRLRRILVAAPSRGATHRALGDILRSLQGQALRRDNCILLLQEEEEAAART